ncbi:MAG: hypothetical protein OEU32_15830 [Acidimicrobiia bacterium]|nr:hypothetical protein [Acidimicrobiia bacterium]
MSRRLVRATTLALVVMVMALVAAGTVSAQEEGGDDGPIGAAAIDPQYVAIHGSACQPANLGQSINFKASWTANGVINPNDLGSARNFFVVCPVVQVDDQGTQPGADVQVHLRYADRDATNRVSCTGYRLWRDIPGFIKTVTTTDTEVGTGTDEYAIQITDLVADADMGFDLFAESAAVVCALVPKSGVAGIVFDSD